MSLGDSPDTNASPSVRTHVETCFETYRSLADRAESDITQVTIAYQHLDNYLKTELNGSSSAEIMRSQLASSYQAVFNRSLTEQRIAQAKLISKKTRGDLDQRKLLNHMIDQQEEKFIEFVEGTRSHISVMDQYLKRLSIALEDDFKVQFYDPLLFASARPRGDAA